MPPVRNTRPNADGFCVLSERIAGLGKIVADMQDDLHEFTSEQRTRDEETAKQLILANSRIEAAHRRLDLLDEWRKKIDSYLVTVIVVPLILFIASLLYNWFIAQMATTL